MRARRLMAVGLLGCIALSAALPAAAEDVIDADPAPAPAERLTPPGRTFTVAAVGDFLPEALVNNAAAAAAPPGVRYDNEPLLRPLEPIIRSADLAICHMEVPIGAPGAQAGKVGVGPYGTTLIAAPYELAGDLKRVGFDRCTTASNHSNDLGITGIRTTLEALDTAGISHAGTARTPTEAVPQVFTVNGVKVANISVARNSNTGWPSDEWRLRRAVTATNTVNDVAAARAAGAEVVIVSLHVFVEMQKAPTADDRALVQQITSLADVDLVVIHGPHVVQPVERVNGTLVYWSLGNLISGMGVYGRDKYSDLRTLDGLMAYVRFIEQPDGTWVTDPWTVLVCNVTGSRIVYPGRTTLLDTTITSTLRTQLTACVNRSVPVVADLH